jgi:uncharacterized protein YceK
MRLSSVAIFAAIPALLAGCASLPPADMANPPAAFHDTRLQYALAMGEDATLAKDFGMKLPPSWVERTVAGAVLPFTAAAEAAFFPFSYGINALAPSQR